MIVVSDTNPIDDLIEIGCFEVLPQIFDRVIIPQTRFNELTSERAPARNKDEVLKRWCNRRLSE